MFENVYGNKVLDFNETSSPFRRIERIFAGAGEKDAKRYGEELLRKTRTLTKPEGQPA